MDRCDVTSPASESMSTAPPTDAVAVPLQIIRDSIPNCDLYIFRGGRLRLYRERTQELLPRDLDRLARGGTKTLYLAKADEHAHRREQAEKIRKTEKLSPSQRYQLLCDITRASFEAAYQEGSLGEIIELIDELGTQLADVLADKDLALGELYSLMSHDDYTYVHCVNVATYTMLLAKYLGITDPAELRAIAAGGMCHDIGKRHIHLQVLNKHGQLDESERKQIEQHPVLGFRDLLPRGDLTWPQLMMVYQHHERFDGRGYPVGLPAAEIHDYARMTTVADIFHALTSCRPYRSPMSIDDACKFLSEQSGKILDPEMTKCWIHHNMSILTASKRQS
jgi:HD-GYP domain-containing protein (c-di-GMP phosphodiesterase class II)